MRCPLALSVLLTAVVSLGQWNSICGQEPSTQHDVRHGDLRATIRDNGESPGTLSGIDQLFNLKSAPEFDAFDPDTPGASAGLNFEHIISGHANPNNKFTPRHGPYRFAASHSDDTYVLKRNAEDSPWKVASTLSYRFVPPHYIDFEFVCTPTDASLFGPRQWALFFFANYMNDVEDVAIHFRGKESADGDETWVRADAPPGPADWNGGGNYRALDAPNLGCNDDVRFRLNTWTYDWPRITHPVYFGRATNNMTLILMFDRLHNDRDQIRFSLFKFKVPKHPRPAWDFQYVIHRVESGADYGFRGRLIWKEFVDAEDCFAEYERWSAKLDRQVAPENLKKRVAKLRALGATVFLRGDHVNEVVANGTPIRDDDLRLLADFSRMTDLSLESTTITAAGLAHLQNLQRLEWLNVYRAPIGDQGLLHIAKLRQLQHLPIGQTGVTDAGLRHLRDMKSLVYLGLRGNRITDDGLNSIRGLTKLEGLHLGETAVSDHGLVHVVRLTKLKRLWLDETKITDQSLGALSKLRQLRELHVVRTSLSDAGLKQLGQSLPKCRIISDSTSR